MNEIEFRKVGDIQYDGFNSIDKLTPPKEKQTLLKGYYKGEYYIFVNHKLVEISHLESDEFERVHRINRLEKC